MTNLSLRFFVVSLVIFISFGSPCASVFAGGAEGKRPITKDEGVYLSAAISYLKESNTLATKVATAMNGVNDGSSTLGDIRDAISNAQWLENVGYHGDYLDRFKGVVPTAFTKEKKQIEEVHRLFQAAMKEYLEYWKDSNADHIASGNATFKRCVILMNKAINATGAELNQLKAQ